MNHDTILVTGGAGFIGSALVRLLLSKTQFSVINVDKLTYAGDLNRLHPFLYSPQHHFIQQDICQKNIMHDILSQYRPDKIIHIAAESHVDRSISAPDDFIQSNIVGTFSLLSAALEYYQSLPENNKQYFRFVHLSTDEVFGTLNSDDKPFDENSPYKPNNPYSASKAAADHLVYAWHKTYGLPTIICHSCNNYGEFQYPEKLIPLTITRALMQQAIPIYGDGTQIRDWLYVEDNADALFTIIQKGLIGERYLIGTNNEWTNLSLVKKICTILDEIYPINNGTQSYQNLIQFVPDRSGHDTRYAINADKLRNKLLWNTQNNFEISLRKTVQWYVEQFKKSAGKIN
ncbi:MAG: dTDP-glucose 4,6-dehydratase [Neisseriaceae bacterium]|nr:dTDP-glucose 4,6-dehydratase [Neisseriaceae bacterium]